MITFRKRSLIFTVIATLILLFGFWGYREFLSPAARLRFKVRSSALRILQDRSQAWWKSHRPDKEGPALILSASEQWDREENPPILTAIFPLELAAWISVGGRPPENHPLADRPVVFLDVRESHEFAAESIEASLNVPASELEESVKSGALSKLDRATVILAYGFKWPHFEVISRLRGPNGFEAVYALEGLDSWKRREFPVVRYDRKPGGSPRQKQSASAHPAPADEGRLIPGLDPLALKVLLDTEVELLCIFVGDRRTYEGGHVPGAVHVPIAELARYLENIPRDRLVVVHCGCCQGRRGGLSESAVRLLQDRGFRRVLHLDGHMHAWKQANLPFEAGFPPIK